MAQDYFDPARAVSIGGGNDDFDPGRAELIQPAGGTASDLAKSLKVGTQRLPGMVTGLADLPFALAAGARPFTKAADALGEVTGFQPGKWADETKFSAGYEQGKQAVDDAWKDGSAGDIALAYLKNPGYTANQVVESAPGMVAGGLAGRALMGVGRVAAPAARAGGVGPAVPGLAERALGQWAAPVAAGVGEGAVTAGQQMAQYQGEDQQKNALASLGAGVVTGGLGVGAGRVANKLGLETAETAIAKAGTGAVKAADDVPLSAKRRILGGMVSEAVLQELPQSAQEQMWQNWSDGKPLMEGVARAATEGAIAGGVMGAGANVSDGGAGKRRALAEQQAKQLSEAEAEALRADPSRAWTTEAGAVDPNQPAGERAAPPEAPELQTSPGAAGPRDGLDFTRDVDTAGLALEDPAEVERARAATMDYEPTDATPQWDTQPGAAPVRSGLDMPAPDFDTGALGFDPRPLSERMGLVPAANTPLTKAAALSVDASASPVQFLGATGRDMQLRQTGPGVADESNVIDVQARVVEDRAIGTPSRLTAQDGARESGAIAFQDGVPRSEIAAIPNIVARAEQLRGYDEAAQKAAQPLALPAPSNLREGLERIRAQREQAARTAQVPPTTGATSVPQANQAQQAVSQQPQAGGPQAGAATATASASQAGGNRVQAAGLTNGAQTQNTGAQAAPAAGAQAAPQRLPQGARLETADRGMVQGMVRYVDGAGLPLSDWAEDEADALAQAIQRGRGAPAEKLLRDHFVAAARADTAMQGNDAAQMLRMAQEREALVNQLVDAGYTQAEIGANSLGLSLEEFNRLVKEGIYSRERGAPDSLFPKRSNSRKAAAGPTQQGSVQSGGKQSAAAGAQGQAPQTAVARPDGWRKSMLRAAPIARAMGIDPKGKRLAQVVAEIDARDTQTPTTPAPQPAPGPVRLGRDNRPLSEGGKPFKTRKAAGDAKKLQPMMRVVSVEGGYALAEKTPAQLAAEERASRRLRSPSTSAPGEPIPAHAFIAAAGGLNRAAAADLGVEGNPRIGNRTLFAGQGRGLSIEQATQMLIQDGYLSEGASHNDAYALIKTSLTRPQYNADGYERIAEAEAQTQFEDYLAAQEEAAAEGDTDPFGMADSFTAEELDDVGYTYADPALQAEVAALTAQADAMGIDTYAILDDIARTYADATQDEFNAKARDALAAAIARGNQDGGSTAAQAAPAAEPAQEPGLTAPTRADIEAQQEARDKAEREEAARQRAADQAASQDENRKRIAQASVRAAAEFELGQNPLDSLTGQGSIFDDAPAQPAPTAASDDEGRERFTLSIEMFGDVPYRASKPVDAGSGDVVSSRVITTKTKLTAANAQALGLPKDKGTVYAWRVSVIRRANGETYAVIEAMATDNGRSPDGEVLAHFKEVENPEAMERIAPAIVKAAMADWQAAQSQQAPAATEPVAQPITRADVDDAQQQASADNRKKVETKEDDTGNVVKFSRNGARGITPEQRAENFARWSDNAPLISSEQAEAYDFKTGQKIVVEAFHGSARPDRIGGVFDPKRATSGPMAYFTSSPELASSYAKGKEDTSLADEDQSYANWFKFKPPGARSAVSIDRAWHFQTPEVQARIRKLAPQIAMDDTGENIVIDPDNTDGLGNYGWELQQARGNPLAALVESWLSSGTLFNEETKFMDVLRMAGFPVAGVEMDFPNAAYPGVFKTYISMKNPLVVGDMPADVRAALEQAAKADRTKAKPGADMWDKRSHTLRDWWAKLNDPDPQTAAYAWTSIPDKVTDVLKTYGYDGIVDWSGKGGGHQSPVYIPFGPTQVKSVFNRGTFDPTKKDISFGRGANAAIGTPAATIRAAITKAYGKLLGQLESKGLVTLTQTQEQAIEAAAQARAAKTGGDVAQIRQSLMAAVKRSIASDGDVSEQIYQEIAADEDVIDALELWMVDGKEPDSETNRKLLSYINRMPAIPADSYLTFYRGQPVGVRPHKRGWASWTTNRDTTRNFIGRNGEVLERKGVQGVSLEQIALWRTRLTGELHDYGSQGEWIVLNDSAFGASPSTIDIRRSANGAIQGFFDPQTGQSFLIADNLTDEAAPGVLMHEVGIHMAADGSMNALFNRAAMMLKLQRGNPFMKAVQARMDAAGETSGEEAAAYIAEAYENDRANAPASVQRWLADLLAAVKAWMFKKGIMGADRLTVADIAAVARANARSMARDGGATGGQGFGPAFSVGEEVGAKALAEFAKADELFALPKSGKDTVAGIAADIDPEITVRVTRLPGETMYTLSHPAFGVARITERSGNPYGPSLYGYNQVDGEITDQITERPGDNPEDVEPGTGDVWLDVSLLKPGQGGEKIYAIAANYAHNTGQIFIGDPAGLSKVALRRRLEQMLSSALKFGTTAHLAPHPDQVRGGDGVPPLQWVYGDHVGNVERMIAASVKALDNAMPSSTLIAYDPDRGFYRTDTGRSLARGQLAFVLKRSASEYRLAHGAGAAGQAGWRTIARAALFRHLQSTIAAAHGGLQERGRLLAGAGANVSRLHSDGTTGPVGSDQERATRIFYSRAGVSNTGGQAATGWDAPTPTGFDDVIYKLQDKNIDLKRVVEAITKSVGQVSDSINAYLKEELFHKRAAKRVADFGDRELKPLMNKMRLAGLSMEDVEEYLHARHAKEANAVIAQRNPGNAGLQDGGSGMTNAAADNYFAKLDPAQRRKLEAVAKSVDAIIDGTRKLYVSYGLEDQAVVDGWANMYQHYIPLMREDKDGGMGTGQGFSVKGKETKGRTGSTRKVVDILANVAMQREKLIVRGEKNIVAQALVGLAQANPNPDFWEVRSQAPTERVFDPKTGVVVDRPDPLFKSRENVAVAKVKDANGKVTEQMVVFNEDNPRAVRMAAAMKNLDAGNLEGLLGVSAKITRYFAAINTQYNPVFGVVNLVRDVQGAMVNLGTTPLAGQQGKIAKDTLSALRGIYGDIRKTRKGGQATSQWSQLWEQMQDDGGTTGYRDLFKTSADRANDLKSILNPEGWMDSKWGKFFTADGRLKVPLSMAQKGATEIFGWLSDYNEAMENGVRLAAYKAALDKGMSREQAASLAKNLTVNFNRKGQAGMQAGAVYAFFNAAMQGTARIGQTLFDMDGGDVATLRLSKTGKAVVYGGVMLGVMQALALSAAGFDDDDPPEFVRERSFIIPTGDKTYVSIPMPLGLHVIPGIGRHATEFALSGFDKPAKRAVSMVGMFADAFNPIGNAGLSMQTIAPTALDPLVALSENKDWTGKPIARVSSNKALPGHTQWKDTATGFSKVVAEGINWISGGNEYVAGAFSPTPDQIDYLLAQVGGGVAREAAKVQQTITTAMSGETLPTHKIPLVGRFIGNAASQASQGSAFYANLNKLNELETEIKGLRKDGRFDEAAKLTRENPQSMMIAMANRAERDVQRLRREKRELIANDAIREQVRAKEDQITAVMTRLNEAVERRKAQAAR